MSYYTALLCLYQVLLSVRAVLLKDRTLLNWWWGMRLLGGGKAGEKKKGKVRKFGWEKRF